jgi:hypothetical protein
MNLPKSAGEFANGSMPKSTSRAFNARSAGAALNWLLRIAAIMPGGTFSHVRGTVAFHIFPAEWRNSPVTEAQENPAALDGVRDGLLDLIYGIGRGNRLANAAGPDHLDQIA